MKILRVFLFIFIGYYLLLIFIFAYQVYKPSCLPNPQNPPSAIIVATGQGGRIKAGECLAQQYHCPLFISGAGYKVRAGEIIKNFNLISRVFLGYDAKNTEQNGLEITKWVKEFQLMSIVVVSHNYHLPRLLLYLRHIPKLMIYFYPVRAPLSSWRFIMEMHKYYFAYIKDILKIHAF